MWPMYLFSSKGRQTPSILYPYRLIIKYVYPLIDVFKAVLECFIISFNLQSSVILIENKSLPNVCESGIQFLLTLYSFLKKIGSYKVLMQCVWKHSWHISEYVVKFLAQLCCKDINQLLRLWYEISSEFSILKSSFWCWFW